MNWVSSILRRADAVSGHRILYVSPDGPGDAAGLVPFFDLITAVEGEVLNETDASLAITISKHVGQLTELSVYNVKTRLTRATFITPNPSWGGPGMLGLVARYDSVPLVLPAFKVGLLLAGGPGVEAGLRAEEDYIIGSDRMSLNSEEDVHVLLGTLMLGSSQPTEKAATEDGGKDSTTNDLGSPVNAEASSTVVSESTKRDCLVLYVFNAPTDTVRTVAIQPSPVALSYPDGAADGKADLAEDVAASTPLATSADNVLVEPTSAPMSSIEALKSESTVAEASDKSESAISKADAANAAGNAATDTTAAADTADNDTPEKAADEDKFPADTPLPVTPSASDETSTHAQTKTLASKKSFMQRMMFSWKDLSPSSGKPISSQPPATPDTSATLTPTKSSRSISKGLGSLSKRFARAGKAAEERPSVKCMWLQYYGIRLDVYATFPHPLSIGVVLPDSDSTLENDELRARKRRLGADDLFCRLTGMTVAQMMDATEDDGDNGGAASGVGVAGSDDEGDDRAAAKKRKTRGDLRRASESAARKKARAMGIFLGDESTKASFWHLDKSKDGSDEFTVSPPKKKDHNKLAL